MANGEPMAAVRVRVNGRVHAVAAAPDRILLHVLREELGLTGAKVGCAEGACGVCTVWLDGVATRACTTRLSEVGARAVTTVEGLGTPTALHRVQRAFLDESAFQCGYCTPGMIMSAAALLERTSPRDAPPDEAAMVEALNGNLCRCGTHPRILRAVRRAARMSAVEDEPTMPKPTMPEPKRASGDPATSPMPVPWDLAHDTDALFGALGRGLLAVPDGAGGAWLHVGEDGTATVGCGKVEVGQGSTAELTRVAASGLDSPTAGVRVILGDTDLVPFDGGTFGSRTTPDAVPAVRAAAAAARNALLELAAAAWGLGPADLGTDGGRVRTSDGAREAPYADLVRGRRQVVRVPEHMASGAAPRQASPPGHIINRRDVVTGQRRYVSDLRLPGVLHAAVRRPPRFGARLVALDGSAAAAMPGVQVVHQDDFAAVVAATPEEALAARDALQPRWEGGGGIDDAGLVDHLRSHPVQREGWGGSLSDEVGDVDAALATAAVRCDATYTTAYIAHEPIETRAALAAWTGDRLTVWTGTQVPFGVREELAAALDLPEERVRVIAAPTGSGYGGKHTGEAAVEAARLARAVGAPVHVRWSREEETTWGYARPAAVIDVRSGASPDGTLLAWDFRNTNAGSRVIDPPYRVETRRLVYQPADGPLRQGSYRALSATANTFARESHLDELAHALGTDPLALRLATVTDDRLAAVLRAAADRAGWESGTGSPHEPGRGLGIAGSVEKGSRVATVAEVRAQAGRPLEIHRIVTAFECGAVIDPDNLENQVTGALIMGLGGALFEALHFVDGRVTNASQSAYRVPRFRDVPPIEVILLDRPDLPSAGAGETPLIALAPAIANAIYAASGIRIRSMPLVPDGVVPAAI
jgi:isoquinoline 1-oxidoreductase